MDCGPEAGYVFSINTNASDDIWSMIRGSDLQCGSGSIFVNVPTEMRPDTKCVHLTPMQWQIWEVLSTSY